MFGKLALLACAGGAGTLCRFGMGALVGRLYRGPLPLGTLFVNMIGCFLFGAFWAYACARQGVSDQARAVVLIGFMGAFTTFSSFAFDTHGMLQNSQWAWALGNALVQNVVGVLFVFLGVAASRGM